MQARDGWEGWTPDGSVSFIMPGDASGTALVGVEDCRDETSIAMWLAQLIRYSLYCETVGIVLRPARARRPRLVATAGVAPADCTAWWSRIRAEIPDLGVHPASMSGPSAQRTRSDESTPTTDSQPRVVRLVLPLVAREKHLGVLLVEFRFGERIMPDVLLRARALAQLAAIALDHERLTREREEWVATVNQLRQDNEHLEAGIAHAVHELRGPLTTVTLGMQVAERHLGSKSGDGVTDDSEPGHAARATSVLNLAHRSVATAGRLLEDLTDTVRMRTGIVEMQMTRCDLAAVVQDAVAGQRLVWPRRIIHLEAPSEAVPVIADTDRIAQVVCNYATNALKYSPDNQPVEVRVECIHGQARVSVYDHGSGLTPEDQQHVWQRFYRAKEYNGQTAQGLGVGLFICRQLIEQMHGRVGVDTVRGEGAAFWFEIALATDR